MNEKEQFLKFNNKSSYGAASLSLAEAVLKPKKTPESEREEKIEKMLQERKEQIKSAANVLQEVCKRYLAFMAKEAPRHKDPILLFNNVAGAFKKASEAFQGELIRATAALGI